MTIESAIKTSLEFENQIRDLYRNAERRIADPVGQRIFRTLADDEQRHVEYLQNRLQEWEKEGEITVEKLDTAIPSREAVAKEIKTLETRMSEEDRSEELQMLKKALDMEIQSSNFYKTLVSALEDEGQRMFARFVEIEEGHEAIVQAEIDYVSGTGFWFDFQEFSLEAG